MEAGKTPNTRSAAKTALLALLGVGALGALYWRTQDVGQSAPAEVVQPPVGQVNPSPGGDDAASEAATGEVLPRGYAWTVEDDRATLRGPVMGTTFSVTLRGPPDSAARAAAAARIEAELEGINAEMSTYDDASALSRFNAGTGPVPVSEAFVEVFGLAQEVYTASDGAFDPTVGPIVRAWGFGKEARPTREPEVEALLPRLGFDELEIRRGAAPGESELAKDRPEIELDLSAVAKGHAAELTCRALVELGHGDLMVEVGGEVCTRGESRAGAPWRIGVERPAREGGGGAGIARVVRLEGPEARAVATSGDYRNYYERDGKRLSHTIDPRTGRPIEHRLASVSVLAGDAGRADAWATALNVLGPDAGLALAEKLELAAFFLVRDEAGFDERMTQRFATHSEAPRGEAP